MGGKTAKAGKTKYVCTVIIETDRRVSKAVMKFWVAEMLGGTNQLYDLADNYRGRVDAARVRSVDID